MWKQHCCRSHSTVLWVFLGTCQKLLVSFLKESTLLTFPGKLRWLTKRAANALLHDWPFWRHGTLVLKMWNCVFSLCSSAFRRTAENRPLYLIITWAGYPGGASGADNGDCHALSAMSASGPFLMLVIGSRNPSRWKLCKRRGSRNEHWFISSSRESQFDIV